MVLVFILMVSLPSLIVFGPLIVFGGYQIGKTLSYSGADRLFGGAGGYHKPKKLGYRRVSNSIQG